MKHVLAGVVVALAAAPALADIEYPTSINSFTGLVGFGSNGLVGNLQAVDGAYLEAPTTVGVIPAGTTFTLVLNLPVAWGNDLDLHINFGRFPSSDGSATGTQVWSIATGGIFYTDSNGNTATYNGAAFNPTPFGGVAILAPQFTIGAFNASLISTLTIQYTSVTANTTGPFQFDKISNPEPGTMALFGLGALGLGGMAWRRRKTSKTDKKS